MVYTFKAWHELAYAILITVIVTLALSLMDFDAAGVKDWQVWAVGVLSGCIRAVASIVVSTLTGKLIFKT